MADLELPYPEITPIVDGAPAKPPLWNFRYTQIDKNFAALLALGNLSVRMDSKTGAAQLPKGTNEERGTPGAGLLRFNTQTGRFEGANGTAWGSLGGATGGGNDDVFYLTGQAVTKSYKIPEGKNAISAGAITITPGCFVEVPTGSSWSLT